MYLISLLPMPIIWLKARFLAFVMHHLVRYRREVIDKNIALCFPNLPVKERKQLRRKFYHHSSRVLLEGFKVLTASEKKINKWVTPYKGHQIEQLFNEPKGALILTGHLGNFEFGGQFFSTQSKLKVFTAYRKFSTGWYEKLVAKMRARFNAYLVPATQIIKTIFRYKNEGLYVVFLNDQEPQINKDFIWVDFFNQPTMFFAAPAKIAQKFNLPVYFLNMWRNKNGYYTFDAELICQDPNSLEVKEIIEKYVQKLEQAIKDHPEAWLWSHNRWKRSLKMAAKEQ